VSEAPGAPQLITFLYGDPRARYIEFTQRKFDIEMAGDEAERERTFEEAGFAKVGIQGVAGFWRRGVLCCTDINDKSTEFWDLMQDLL